MKVLELEGLEKSYSVGFIPQKRQVLKGVSFSISPGKITGFLGANGSGKTTTIKCTLGLSFPDSGDIRYFGEKELSSTIKRRIGFLPEHPYFYSYLTGKEFLRFYGQISTKMTRLALDRRIDDLLKRVDLLAAKDVSLGGYSKGMLQKIGLAQALIHGPELVILDEPMSGLDPDGRFALSEIIRETAKEGTAVFFSSHLLNDAEKLCDSLVILKNGSVCYEGPTLNLLKKSGDNIEIVFTRRGQLIREVVDGVDKSQQRIDAIRKDGGSIIEVSPMQMSLEEAFVGLAMREAKV